MNKLLLASMFLTACGGSSADGPDADPSDLRTLDSCTTSVDADVPAFYQTYFACSTITADPDGTVTIVSDDLPPHPSYYYGAGDPNYVDFDTRGGAYHANPNTLSQQHVQIAIPPDPSPRGPTITGALVDGEAGTSQDEYPLGSIGVALDSVSLFSGTAAPGDDIAQEAFTFDSYEAHPSPDGAYHYHAPTPGPIEVLAARALGGGDVYGILCDGTVVLGCTELDGSDVTGTLDAQGGHVGDLTDAAGTTHFTARYHVHVCDTGHGFTPEIQYYSSCSPS